MRIQKHIELANGKAFPTWFLQEIPFITHLKVYEKDDTKNALLRQIFIASLYFSSEEGLPCMRFLEEYKANRSSKKNSVRAFDIEFAISNYPREVLQKIQSINGNCVEEGKPEILTKTMMYFPAARTSLSEISGTIIF
jgi:hypothetical protein